MFHKVNKLLLVVLCVFLGYSNAYSAVYPQRAITVINPYAVGGWVEVVGRTFLDAMSKELGVPVVMSMMPGAGTAIGITKATQSKPDGYTLFLGTQTTFSYQPLLKQVRYTFEDMNPVLGIMSPSLLLATSNKNEKYKTFAEMVEYAKANPGTITVGVLGLNGNHFVYLKRIEEVYGIKLRPVPFDGAIQITNAIVGRHIDMGITGSINTELQPLVALSGKTDFFPDTPDFEDLGSPEITENANTTLLSPKGTPEDVMEILRAAALKAHQDPTFIKMTETMKVNVTPITKEEFYQDSVEQRELVKRYIEAGILTPEK